MRAIAKPLAAALACAALLGGVSRAFADPAGQAPEASAPPAQTHTPEAGQCPARSPEALPSMESYARIQERLRAEAAAAGGDAPIVLNGRGYNYGPGPDPVREMQVIEAERARERQQQ